MSNLQLWVSALAIGCFYGLIALGYYLTLIGTGFFNFALGPYAMLMGISTSWLVVEADWSVLPAAAVSLAVTAMVAGATELFVVRPVQRRTGAGDLPALVAVAGVLFAIQQGSGVLFGYGRLPGQTVVGTGRFTIGDAVFQPWAVPLLVITLGVFVAATLWIRYTRSGRVLRAIGDNPEAASILGLPVNRVRLTAFVLSGVIAAIAGMAYAPKSGVGYASGLEWTLGGFLALVIGGTGALWAPLLGGMILGAAYVFIPYYFGGPALEYSLVVIAVIFFAFRPEGIFARMVRT